MNQPQLLTKATPPNWLKVLVIILIGCSIFFRFAYLEKKIYCCDEAWTSVAISGHKVAELKQEISDHQSIIPITTFDKYQHINPEHGVADTVNYLITSDPQHPPLYYVMVRLWAQLFGDSPAGVRSLSALISLLIFPSVYWLCLEMFESPVVGWVAMGLIAVSPMHLYFAQEARQYSLWMVEILVSSAALLKAIRQENKVSWGVYSLSLILGLYTHLFTILVMISHGIYVFYQQQFRFTKTLLNYLFSTTATFLTFFPWVIVLVAHVNTVLNLTSGWTLKSIDNPFELIAIFLVRLIRTFFDINLSLDTMFRNFAGEGSLVYSILSLICSLILIIYSGYFLIKIKLIGNTKGMLIILLGCFPALLLIYDIVFGGIRSLQVRYQLPLYLSLEVLVAYILAFYIFQDKTWHQQISNLILIGFLIAGLVSELKFVQAKNWWIQLDAKYIIETSQILKQSDEVLLVINDSPINLGGILTLSHDLTKVYLLPQWDDNLPPIPQNYPHIFFMQNNSHFFHQMQQNQNYSLQVLKVLNPPPGGLWEFHKIES
ncbi:MAG: glycosyltransferase family 39 protein [Scytonema sp. PMC 1070.18]|nr:glycosyltransferase family 39 protein [Scytonema sp. PMC 1070.18]